MTPRGQNRKKSSVLVPQAKRRKKLKDGKSGKNRTCLRGFEPPTFGSGVLFPTLLDIWGKPDFQGEMSCFPLRTFSQN